MPIFRIGAKLHYFAHVPKCGGVSVDSYLMERFGPIALREPDRFKLEPQQRWSRTSPIHMPAATLKHMIPSEWLSSSFAVVRHPVRRVISAFCFARDHHRYLPLNTDFNTWFQEATSWVLSDSFRYGGHFAPMSSFVPEGSRIFRLEDGLDQVIPYLDELDGKSDGPRHIAVKNVGRWRGIEAAPVPTDETLALIETVYAEDFERFGYERVRSLQSLAALPDLPTLSTKDLPPMGRSQRLTTRLVRTLSRKAGL
ncbi:MAG: sulfotransferase family 2 domain-containing protein [Tabrizicola sp.]|nr:sulfotransferase family 2 domain-containing protein [Tabrizicola sp.]